MFFKQKELIMTVLNSHELEQVSGGFLPLIAAGVIGVGLVIANSPPAY